MSGIILVLYLVTGSQLIFIPTFLYYPFCISSTFQQAPQWLLALPGGVMCTLIPDGFVSFVILLGLDYL